MVNRFRRSPLALGTLLGGTLLTAAGCQFVKRDVFESEVARLRQDMVSGDQQVQAQATSQVTALGDRMQALEEGLRGFEEEFGARVQRIEGSLRVQAPIHFGRNGVTLDAGELTVLQRLAGALKEYYPDALLTVEGFTDSSGSRAYNLKLGQRRADEVRSYLVTAGGLSPEQVRSVSYGEDSNRIVTFGFGGETVSDGRENRRAVIVIDHAVAGSWRRRTATQ